MPHLLVHICIHTQKRKIHHRAMKLSSSGQVGVHKTPISFHAKEREKMQMFRRENTFTQLL